MTIHNCLRITGANSRRRNLLVSYFLSLFVICLVGCTSPPRDVYRAYTGPELSETSLALLDLGKPSSVSSVQIDGMYYLEVYDYSLVKLLPGPHRLVWHDSFGVSVLVDTRMSVEFALKAAIDMQAGHTYRLCKDRTTGKNYRAYMWIEDTTTGNVVAGEKMP